MSDVTLAREIEWARSLQAAHRARLRYGFNWGFIGAASFNLAVWGFAIYGAIKCAE